VTFFSPVHWIYEFMVYLCIFLVAIGPYRHWQFLGGVFLVKGKLIWIFFQGNNFLSLNILLYLCSLLVQMFLMVIHLKLLPRIQRCSHLSLMWVTRTIPRHTINRMSVVSLEGQTSSRQTVKESTMTMKVQPHFHINQLLLLVSVHKLLK